MKNLYFLRSIQIALILLLLGFTSVSHSQEKLFSEETTFKQSDLNRSELIKLNNIRNNTINKNVHLVNLINKKTLAAQKTLQINIPRSENTQIMETTKVDRISENELIWYGELKSEPYGTAMIIAKDGAMYGQINIGDAIFMIEDLGERKNLLLQLDHNQFGPETCATPHEKPNAKEIPEISDDTGQRNVAIVRVLVLFTNAADNIGNPQNSANLFIAQANQALQNSAITAGQLRFQLAAVQRLNGFGETTNIFNDRNNLRLNANARAMRDNTEADIVVLLTNGPYGSIQGIAYLDQAGNEAFGYAISEIDAAGGRFTFVHEMAHLFGAKHDNDNRVFGNLTAFGRGHSFFAGGATRRTIMAGLPAGQARIQNFSNPNVFFQGVRTGVANQRDNARQLRNLAGIVCDYRGGAIPPSVNLTGDFHITTGEYGAQNYTANVNNGTAPFTYEWCLSIYNSCYTGTSNTAGYTVYPNGNPYWNLRVTVTDANGSSASTNRTIQIQQPYNYQTSTKDAITISKAFDEKDIALYPNPTSNNVNLKIQLAKPSDITISLVNLLGRTEKILFSGEKPQGIHTLSKSISAYQDGLYYIIIDVNGEVSSKKLLIQN